MTRDINTIGVQKERGFLRKLLIVLLPILIVLGCVIAANIIIKLNKKPEEKKRPFNTLAVMADYAVEQDVQLKVVAQGEARPRTEIDLVPEVGGKIVYVSPNFLEGGIIRKGETLIRIEDADFKVAVVRAESGIAQAQQVLIREQAEAEIARRDYEELGRGEPSDLALRKPQQAQAQASLQLAQAELEAAKLQLTRTDVKAPFTGRVTSKSSDLGQFVSPGRTLGRIFSTDVIEVRLPLSDNDLSRMDLPIAYVAKDRVSAPDVKLSAVIAGQTQYWDAKIMRTSSTYDRQTRALSAIAEVFDPYGKGKSKNGVPIAPGLFVEAEISGKLYEDVIVLPRDGLRPEDEIYIVDDKGKVEIRTVDVLDSDAKQAFLLGGVSAGELVVLSPMERSRVTMTLKVLDVNDPKKLLVDPPKPDWLKKKEAAAAKGGEQAEKKKRRWGRKKDEAEKPLKKRDVPAEEKSSTETKSANFTKENEQ